ncbi:MAG: SGNH/GDSL hydrolase family protein [Actinomycetota bacterium]
MTRVGRNLSVIPAVPVAAAAVVAAQVLRAAHRSDLPSFLNQEPSGTFGDPGAPTLRIVALGDSSITAPGVEVLDNAWIRRVARALAQDRHVELISVAVGGAKARDVIEGQLAEAIRLRPDVALVSVGANDALRGVSPRRYRTALRAIIDRLEDTGAAVVLYGMGDMGCIPRLPSMLRSWATRRSDVFDRVARRVAADSRRTVKVHTQGRVRTAFRDPALFAGDLFHANDAGHEVFAEAALPAFEAAIALAKSSRDR